MTDNQAKPAGSSPRRPEGEAYSSICLTDGGRDIEDADDDERSLPPGWDHDDDGPLHPPGWEDWDRPARLNYLTLGHTRADLLAHIRGFIGSDRGSDRLSKQELAAIAIDLEAI